MRVLVVGGAGYIGSHTVRELRRRGMEPVVFDNYSTGHPESVQGVEQIQGDLLDPRSIRAALENFHVEAVIHLAARCVVQESSFHPTDYYRVNVGGTLNLVHAMLQTGVHRLIFSSSAAVYGEPHEIPISEDHERQPAHPYGFTKLFAEKILTDVARVEPLRFIGLRYFNVAGADHAGDIGEAHENESHLIPRLFQVALGQIPMLQVFGSNYDTPDGTCIRDFIHVNDIARAHILALERLDDLPNQSLNLGSNEGYSVKEVVQEAQRLLGRPVAVVYGDRRPGDPPVLVATNARAKELLGWVPQHSELSEILDTAWNWHRRHPHGYGPVSEDLAQRESQTTELFGDIAIRLGYVTEADVVRALERQKKEMEQGNHHKLIGMHMLEMGILSTSDLIEILKYYEEQ